MLTLTDKVTGYYFTVEHTGEYDRDGKTLYRWEIGYVNVGGDFAPLAEATDLHIRRENDAEALSTLLDFFSAWCEALGYPGDSDNKDLFPEALKSIAESLGSDGVYMLKLEAFGELDN